MSPTDFGFDPTMKLYQSNSQYIQSYQIPNAIIEMGYESLKWVFEMPAEDGLGRESFITVRLLSMNRAEVVQGRGTRLWVVCKLNDFLSKKPLTTEVRTVVSLRFPYKHR